MTRTVLLVMLILVLNQAVGQLAKPVRFSEETFDFGNVIEENGPVVHEFVLTNASEKPVTILSVKPSCGCTTPDWSKGPIMPGKTGFVKAQFDPKGRPGYFHKSLTVTTDYNGQPIILYIKGQVVAKNAANSSEYQAISGKWKLRSLSFNLGKIYRKDEFVTRNVSFVNGGEKPVSYLDRFEGPSYIKLDVQPKTVNPGERGEIKISYNGKQKDQYGFQSDNVVIHTDDELLPDKAFTVYVTLEDYFAPATADELAKAPQLKIAEMGIDMGNIRQNQSASREISFINNGKSVLEIRSIQGNCSCVVGTTDKEKLKPGENGVIKIVFTPQDRKGTQTKSVIIYSNDPVNPVQRITVGAYAE